MAQRTPTRKQMLDWIDMVSFAVTDSLMYLDTHPTDRTALAYYQEYCRLRKQALKDYSAVYGPLQAEDCSSNMQEWNWILQPWPWEGGNC